MDSDSGSDSRVLVDNQVIDAVDIQQPLAKRRRKKSMVWNHFTTEITGPDSARAFCKHCNKSYAYKTGTKTSGTSHLKRHIVLGICQKCPQMDEQPLPVKKRQRCSSSNVAVGNTDRCNHEIAKMIIMHDYPLHMVEHPGFTGFVQSLRPRFNAGSFDSVHDDCVAMFLSEKEKLLDFVGKIPGAVNLTVDLWLSNQSVGYAFVSGQFVDKDWNLTRRLLNVSVVACPDSDTALNQPVAACLSDWKLEGKISSIAVSKLVVNKTSVDNLRGFLSARNQHVLNEQLLMGACYARVLSSMAQDLLTAGQLQAPIKKVRDSIKFVNTNETCGDKFDELKRMYPTPSSKELLLDNQRRWDTSYNMLVAACEHRHVFSCLQCHPEYKISISPEEWTKIENLCSCLKVLYEACNAMTGPTLLTSRDLFDEMTNLQQGLNHAATCEDLNVRDLANQLREKFDLYWRGCYLVLAVAVVLDPRAKMEHINLTFENSYGKNAEEWTKTVNDAIRDLYLSYSDQNLNLLDVYVDNGTSETEMGQEPHLHQDRPQDANTGNGQPVDETSPQVEQTTETLHHERQHSGEKQNVEGPGEGESEERQLTGEDQQLGDDSQANVIAEGASEERHLTEEDQQLGDDSQADMISEEDISSFPVDSLLEEGATLVTIGDSLSEFDIYIQEMSNLKSELESYMELSLIPRSGDFNILRWWRENSVTYPTLSKMAFDILTVPFCTVSPDSVFDREVKQMDDYRTSLPRATLEALLCTKDWLKNKTS